MSNSPPVVAVAGPLMLMEKGVSSHERTLAGPVELPEQAAREKRKGIRSMNLEGFLDICKVVPLGHKKSACPTWLKVLYPLRS